MSSQHKDSQSDFSKSIKRQFMGVLLATAVVTAALAYFAALHGAGEKFGIAATEQQKEQIAKYENQAKKIVDDLVNIRREWSDVRVLARLENTESKIDLYETLPIGTILPFVGDPNTLPSNWVLANSTGLPEDADPYLQEYLGGRTPNLMHERGVFLAGFPGPISDATKREGGNVEVPPMPVTGTLRTVIDPPLYFELHNDKGENWGYVQKDQQFHSFAWDWCHDCDQKAKTREFVKNGFWPLDIDDIGGADNRPPFYKVMYIIRIR